MATIVKRGQAWQAKVRKHGVCRSGTFRTRQEAEAWAALQEREAANDLAWPVTTLDSIRSIPDILRANSPVVRGSGVYFLFDGFRLVYIGESSNVMARILQHLKNGRPFDRFAAFPCPASDRKAVESRLIARFCPSQNAKGQEWGNDPETRAVA